MAQSKLIPVIFEALINSKKTIDELYEEVGNMKRHKPRDRQAYFKQNREDWDGNQAYGFDLSEEDEPIPALVIVRAKARERGSAQAQQQRIERRFILRPVAGSVLFFTLI